MTLQSSGAISMDNVRREFREGMTSASTYSDGAVSNAALADYRGEAYYQNAPPTSGSVSLNNYYGLDGRSGWFYAGRRGSSPAYLWGWKEYAGGQFFWPEAGDSISSMGSATTSTRRRMASKFYITAVLFGYYYDSYNSTFNGNILTVYGVESNPNGYSRNARNIRFKDEHTGSTHMWSASSASGLTYNADGDHSYHSPGRVCYKWQGSGQGYDLMRYTFENSYAYGKKIYWQTY